MFFEITLKPPKTTISRIVGILGGAAGFKLGAYLGTFSKHPIGVVSLAVLGVVVVGGKGAAIGRKFDEMYGLGHGDLQ